AARKQDADSDGTDDRHAERRDERDQVGTLIVLPARGDVLVDVDELAHVLQAVGPSLVGGEDGDERRRVVFVLVVHFATEHTAHLERVLLGLVQRPAPIDGGHATVAAHDGQRDEARVLLEDLREHATGRGRVLLRGGDDEIATFGDRRRLAAHRAL